jgi:transcriptional regulator
MYTPRHFAMDELSDQHALIDACDFGVVVSQGPEGLFATHIPLMLKRDEGAFGTLYGHLARSNPHVGLLGSAALVIFSGPHAYVSPSWFSDRSMNVPTWNYSAVHCTGVPQATGGDQLAHLRQMAERYESARPNGWSVDELKADMRESLPRGIVTFRMEIARIEGKAKLSQNKPRAERERIIEGLKADGEAKLAARMVQELEKA